MDKDKVEAVRQEIARFYPHCYSTYCPDPPTLAEPDRPLSCPNDCNVCLAREILSDSDIKRGLELLELERQGKLSNLPECDLIEDGWPKV